MKNEFHNSFMAGKNELHYDNFMTVKKSCNSFDNFTAVKNEFHNSFTAGKKTSNSNHQ